MATVGLNIPNPYLGLVHQDAGQPEAMSSGASNIAQFGQAALAQLPPLIQPQAAPDTGKLQFNTITREVYINGVTAAEDDDTRIAEAAELLDRPSVGSPQGEGWVDLDRATFGEIVGEIKSPSLWRVFSKNFGIGVDQLQQLGGYGLQLAGAEELGGRIVAQQEEDLAKSAIYNRQFTDIENSRGAVEWFVGALGQQGPMLLESIGFALVGYAAGTAAAGPAGGALGTIGSVFLKKEFKDKIRKEAGEYAAQKAKGVTPDIKNFPTLRQASGIGGAVVATGISNYAIGVGDVYGAMREEGIQPEDFAARMQALAAALPYAALESGSDFIIGSRIIKGFTGAAAPAGASVTKRGANLLRRGAAGAAVGATAEGFTELGQEMIVRGASGQELFSDEAITHYINSFAAGAAVGGTIGGIANLRRGRPDGTPDPKAQEEVNLLDTRGSVTGTPQQTRGVTGRPDFVSGAEGVRPSRPSDAIFTGEVTPGQFGGPQGVLDIGGAPIDELRRRSMETGEAARPVWNPETGQYEQQMVSGAPLADRPALPPPTPPTPPGQGVIQFAPEAPSGPRFTGLPPAPNTFLGQWRSINEQRELQAQAQQERQQQIELAEQQRAQQDAAVREQQMDLMQQQVAVQRDRQVYEAELARQAEPQPPVQPLTTPPMVPVQPRMPQQLPLFPRKEVPIPSRGEGLRRGVGTQITPAEAVQQPTPLVTTELDAQGRPQVVRTAVPPFTSAEARRAGQLPLFTQEGQPSVAALKSAGTRGPLPLPELEAGTTQIPPTGSPANAVTIAAARQRLAMKRAVGRVDYEDGAYYEGQLKNGVPNGDGVYYFADGDSVIGKFKDGVLADGKHTYLFANGSTYVGDFKNTVFDGQGVFTDTDGTVVDGEFKDGEYVPPKPPTPPKKSEALKKGKQEPKPKTEPKKADTLKRGEKAAPKTEQKETTPVPREDPFRPASMAELEAQAAAQRPLRTSKTERVAETTVAELVDDAIALADSTVDTDAFADAAATLMFHAYVDTETNNRAANAKARAFIESTEFDSRQRQALNDALVDEIDIKGKVELHRDTEFKPVYKYLVDNNLLPRLNATTTGLKVDDAARLVREGSLALTNLPDSTAKEVIAANPDLVAADADNLARGQKDDVRENPGTRLADAIRALNLSNTRLKEATRTQKLNDLKTQWDALPDEYRDFVDETGTPLSEYFDNDTPKSTIVNGKLRITKQAYTDEQVVALEAADTAEVDPDVALAEREDGRRADWDAWNRKLSDGNFSRDDGTPITAPLAVGRIRMAVTKFVNRLFMKPQVFIYKNQADLKAKNPRLHQRAADSRPQGDFDSTPAAGFSFGDGNVIIFSDYIATEQQLNFVLAHETFGHFGLRGIIPVDKFDALMTSLYNTNPAIRGDVDAAMANNRKLSLPEAVEEYLSDFAGVLDTSVVARIWNAIKGALNKLGVQFGDESARYLVNQARRYVRNGKVGVPFDVAAVMRRLHEVEYGLVPASTGRFSTPGNVYTDVRVSSLMLDKIGSLPMNMQEGWDYLKGQGINNVASYDRLKAKFLSLANFRSRENLGSSLMEELLEQMRNRSMSIKVGMNEKLREVLNKAVFGKLWGVTDVQLARLDDVLYEAQRYAVNNFKLTAEAKRPPLFSMQGGVLTPNQAEINRLSAMGRISFKQMKEGFTYDIQVLKTDGKFETETVKFKGIADLTDKSIEWRGYNQLRDVMNDVEIQLLKAHYASAIANRKITFSELSEVMANSTMTAEDEVFLSKAMSKFKDIYTENIKLDDLGAVTWDSDAMTRGDNFLIAFNQALIGEATDRTAKVAAYFKGKEAADFGAYLNEFKKRLRLPDDNKLIVQNRVKQLIMTEVSSIDHASLFTRRSLATGYTPILREGKYQMRVEATDPVTGDYVQLRESSRDQLIYSQFETPAEAKQFAGQINEILAGKTYKVEGLNPSNGMYEVREVKLTAIDSASLDAIAAPPELNLNEFVRGLHQFDMTPHPKVMQTIVQAMTNQNSAARNRLQRSFVEGFKREGVMAISRHVEGRASTIAKTQLRPHMAELLNLRLSKTQKLWNGDRALLAKLKANAERVAADPSATQDHKTLAQKEYERYKFMYDSTNPEGKPQRGMVYYNEASRTASFLDGNRNVDESDFGSGKLVSTVRAVTSMMQLGASIATGTLNIIGAYTNGLPYLASYNKKNSFGGGFGMGPAVAQFHMALKDVGGIGMNPFSETSRAANRAEFYDQIANSPDMQRQYNLKEHEARFIAGEIRDGNMIPAQSNALVGMARGNVTSGFMQKFVDGWMMPFNLTEQASRRALGLAAYRLEYQRQLGAGKTAAEANVAATKFASTAIQQTLGEYSVLNRPPAWRSGIQSFIYMYKVFPTTSIQLMMNLSRNGKIGMLAGLFLLSGLTGLPFTEDLEDVIDTLAQKLGFKTGSIRYEIAKFIDGVLPGMSPYMLTGFMNAAIPGNIASRTSLGNVFPGTGMFLAGADVGREMMDIAGPAASALTGSIKSLADAMRIPFSQQVSTLSVAREAPVTMIRAAADAYAYTQAGAIIDRRGYMVSDDMHMGTIAARLLGFYPNAASDQYSMIRVAKRMTDYQRDVTAAFRTAWITAMQTNDRERARAVEEAVADWNKGAKGTTSEIKNFRAGSMRALREARRPAGERALRSAPRAAREDMERLSTLLSY